MQRNEERKIRLLWGASLGLVLTRATSAWTSSWEMSGSEKENKWSCNAMWLRWERVEMIVSLPSNHLLLLAANWKKKKKRLSSKLLPGTTDHLSLDFLFGSFFFWPWFDNLARTTSSSHDTFPANSKITVALMCLDLVIRHNLIVF